MAEGFVERRLDAVISRVPHIVAILDRADRSAHQVWIWNRRARCGVGARGRSVSIERSLIQIAENRKMGSLGAHVIQRQHHPVMQQTLQAEIPLIDARHNRLWIY